MHAAVNLPNTPLPVTLLTGFLGSGKTTLINALLRNHPDERIAIIENEFGSVGIDGGLIHSQADVEVIELSNGCVCCSIRGELSAALQNILAKIDRGELNIQRLILETTGLADPGPIIQTFFVDEIMRERIRLDAVITLVDAHHITRHLDEHRVAAAQIGFADRMILTKTDLIPVDEKDSILQRIQSINAKAEIFEAINGTLPKACWLDIAAFDLDESSPINANSFSLSMGRYAPATAPTLSSEQLFHTFTPVVSQQSWNDEIQSYVFEAGEMDLGKLDGFMEDLVAQYGNDMLRYKGVLAIAHEERPLIIQGVHKVVGFDYGNPTSAQPQRSLMIVIGRHLPYETFREQFLQAQTTSD